MASVEVRGLGRPGDVRAGTFFTGGGLLNKCC